MRSERGQASIVVVGGLVAVVLGALVLGLVARGGGREARAQRAADLGALAAARAMHDSYSRLFEPVFADREPPGANHLGRAEYLALGRAAGERVARANEITVSMAGQTVLKAQFTIDREKKPSTIDYLLPTGQLQHGIYDLQGKNLKVISSAPGEPRPADFSTSRGDGKTCTVWRFVKA